MAETTKYLYLLFDPNNFLNNDGSTGTIIDTIHGECLIDSGNYIFNTEAHPIDASALRCCSDIPKESLLAGYDSTKFSGENFRPTIAEDLNNNHTFGSDIQSNIIEEIMKILIEPKKSVSFENEQEDRAKKAIIENDSLISVEQKTMDKNVEIVKLPVSARDPDDKNASIQKKKHNLNELSLDAQINENSADNIFKAEDNDAEEIVKSSQNNSILSEFVQSLMKSSHAPTKKFDPQQLLNKIKESGSYRNATWNQEYKLLTCKSQPYSQRISVLGEFF